MTLATPTKQPWVTQRRCVGCGLRAESGKTARSRPASCPRCGIDWHQRPPRSYAELEGFELEGEPEAAVGMAGRAAAERRRRSAKWLRVLEVGLFVLLIAVALGVASANIVAALRGAEGAAGF